MSDTEQRLVRCFQAVFPDLSANDVTRASASSLAAWDSVATVTLAAALEEEFNVQFELEEIEKMNSFQNCLNVLSGR